MNAGGNGQLLARMPRLEFGLREQNVFCQRGRFIRDGVEKLMIEFGERAGLDLAVEIEQTEELSGA